MVWKKSFPIKHSWVANIHGAPQEVMSQLSLEIWAEFLEFLDRQGQAGRGENSLLASGTHCVLNCLWSGWKSQDDSVRQLPLLSLLILQMSNLKETSRSHSSRRAGHTHSRQPPPCVTMPVAVSFLPTPAALPHLPDSSYSSNTYAACCL